MTWSWKPLLFIALNLFSIGWLAAMLVLLLWVINGEDPLALLGIVAADVAFLTAGIGLAVLNRYYSIAAANRALPFVATAGLTAVAVMNVSDATLWFGVALSAALIVASLITTIMTLAGRKAG